MGNGAPRRIVILGAGQAGVWTAITLRKEGFAGDLLLVGDEERLPYERPPLSKGVLAGTQSPESTTLFDADALKQCQIKLVTGTAEAIDTDARTVRLMGHDQSDKFISYDRLVIATGARNRQLECPGADLPCVDYLRTLADAANLQRDLTDAQRLLVIGGGWIGLEVAATARMLGKQVTLLESGARLCSRSLSVVASEHLAELHRRHNVDLRIGVQIERLEGCGRVERVVLRDGSTVPCDCVLVGIGAVANDELATDAGIATAGGILVDGFGRTSAADVFAVGDVSLQDNSHLLGRIRLESWENAQDQAIHCARVILGIETKAYDPLPWIWSDQYDFNIQILGFPPKGDDETIVLPGSCENDWLFGTMRAGQLNGAVGFNRGREIKMLKRLHAAGHAITPDVLKLPPNEMAKLMRQAPVAVRKPSAATT